MRGWWNTVGNLIEFLRLNKTYHRLQFIGIRVPHRGGTVSSNSKFQTVLFQQDSANLSMQDLLYGDFTIISPTIIPKQTLDLKETLDFHPSGNMFKNTSMVFLKI